MEENKINQKQDRIIEITNQLSYNQLRFVAARLECDTDKEASLKIGLLPTTVSAWPERELIREALTLMTQQATQGARAILQRNAIKAALVKSKGLDSDDPKVAQQAASDILSWVIGKPTQRNEFALSDDDLNDAIKQELANMALLKSFEDVTETSNDEQGES